LAALWNEVFFPESIVPPSRFGVMGRRPSNDTKNFELPDFVSGDVLTPLLVLFF